MEVSFKSRGPVGLHARLFWQEPIIHNQYITLPLSHKNRCLCNNVHVIFQCPVALLTPSHIESLRRFSNSVRISTFTLHRCVRWRFLGRHTRLWRFLGRHTRLWRFLGKHTQLWRFLGRQTQLWRFLGKYTRLLSCSILWHSRLIESRFNTFCVRHWVCYGMCL